MVTMVDRATELAVTAPALVTVAAAEFDDQEGVTVLLVPLA